MSVLQYIGARYVPLFDGEWDSTKEYEPLTVVMNQGASYTSKQSVPAGIQISNENYWFPTGNYNAQIEMYRREVANAVKNVDNKGRKRVAVYIGNSYTYGAGSSTGDKGVFGITKGLFDEAFSFTKGGQGFAPYSVTQHRFIDSLSEAAASPQFDNDDVTDVIIVSAMGDTRALAQGMESTVRYQVQECANYVKANFPNAVCYLSYAECVYGRNTETGYSTDYPLLQYKMDYIFETICRNYGMVYLGWNGYACNNRAGFNASDNFHPNDNGYKIITTSIINAMYGYNPYAVSEHTVTCKNGYTFVISPISPNMGQARFSPINKSIFEGHAIPNQKYVVDYLMDSDFLAEKLVAFTNTMELNYWRYSNQVTGFGRISVENVGGKLAVVFTPIGINEQDTDSFTDTLLGNYCTFYTSRF